PQERIVFEREILLEHGRQLELPPIELPPKTEAFSVEFSPRDGAPGAMVEVMTGEQDQPPEWIEVATVPIAARGPARVRLIASESPVWLGDSFEAEMRDTWVQTAPPEEPVVAYIFQAPSGRIHRVVADYIGNQRWRVHFEPEELGRWTYRFEQTFTVQGLRGPEAVFDVLVREIEDVVAAIDARAATLESGGNQSLTPLEARAHFVQLMRLERAGGALLGPEGLRGPDGERFRTSLARFRAALQEPLPDELLFYPSP